MAGSPRSPPRHEYGLSPRGVEFGTPVCPAMLVVPCYFFLFPPDSAKPLCSRSVAFVQCHRTVYALSLSLLSSVTGKAVRGTGAGVTARTGAEVNVGVAPGPAGGRLSDDPERASLKFLKDDYPSENCKLANTLREHKEPHHPPLHVRKRNAKESVWWKSS